MTIETFALLVTSVGALILGLIVYLVATREARRDLKEPRSKANR